MKQKISDQKIVVKAEETLQEKARRIGQKTISRPGIITNYIDQIRRIYVLDIKMSGLDERQKNCLQKQLDDAQARSPKAVITGKMRIQLTDDVPL